MSKNINPKGRRISGRFFALPNVILNSAAFCNLSFPAARLLLDLGEQFNPNHRARNCGNNGDLCCAFSVMQRRGWRSKATLAKARDELLASGLIEQTRQGGLNVGPSLYALTWHPIDECLDGAGNSKLDRSPSNRPSNLWKFTDQEAA